MYYNNLLQTRNNYLTQLLQCNNFQRTYKDFKPELQFKYDEGEYEKLNYNYSYSDTLLKKRISEKPRRINRDGAL